MMFKFYYLQKTTCFEYWSSEQYTYLSSEGPRFLFVKISYRSKTPAETTTGAWRVALVHLERTTRLAQQFEIRTELTTGRAGHTSRCFFLSSKLETCTFTARNE